MYLNKCNQYRRTLAFEIGFLIEISKQIKVCSKHVTPVNSKTWMGLFHLLLTVSINIFQNLYYVKPYVLFALK